MWEQILIVHVFMFQSTDFLIYVAATVSVVLALVLHFEPRCGQTNILVYLGICSLMGSLTVTIFSLSYQLFAILHGRDAMKLPACYFILW